MRMALEGTFETLDGETLFYRYWPAESTGWRGAIVLFHRGHEHSGRVAHLVEELDLPEFAFFAWDARGHGRSAGVRGDSPSVARSVEDIQAFVDHIGAKHGVATENIAVVGQSLSAVLLAAWAHDYAPRVRAMVLAAPAFRVKLYVPWARPLLRLLHRVRGNFFVTSYVKARFLTHDDLRIASFESDALITRSISVRVLLGLCDLAKRIVADAEAITVATQVLISGCDWVVDASPQHDFYERLGALTKERHVFEGFYHDTLGEKDRRPALNQVRSFLLKVYDASPERPSLCDADRRGFTRREADALARPLAKLSWRGLCWGAVGWVLKVGSQLSHGIRLGAATGFDSGSSLDYVCRNEAQGATALGRWVDRLYLDSIGWRGIRQRKRNVQSLLQETIDRVRQQGLPARIVDIAAGSGRYVLDALDGCSPPETVELRDYSDASVAAARALIRQRGFEAFTSVLKADAFDVGGLSARKGRFTIGVVSGLYELYADNDQVRRSLHGLSAAIEPGGYLIYTGQPWHPQLQLIARALTSHRQGRPWIMRRRTQAELDQLIGAAGFLKISERIDEWGMFTVSLARRISMGARAQAASWPVQRLGVGS